MAIEMDLERDIDDFLGIDPDAPEEEESPTPTEPPLPEPDEVDGGQDLGDDSKEDHRLKEKPNVLRESPLALGTCMAKARPNPSFNRRGADQHAAIYNLMPWEDNQRASK
ncbi:MAG: hypothetical protein HQL51_10535 [Magnetococcales bacterium]|nr:hypothetical protein [Magnetococcales bacterium]